jgi:hypothetical protein
MTVTNEILLGGKLAQENVSFYPKQLIDVYVIKCEVLASFRLVHTLNIQAEMRQLLLRMGLHHPLDGVTNPK